MPNCGYSTIEGSDAVAVAQLTNHNLLHQLTGNSANANNSAQLKGPRLERPRIDMGVDCETWNTFERRWDNFLRGSGIDANHAPIQLFQCANDSLGDALLKTDPDITSRTLDEVKKAMKLLSIIPVSRSIKRAELVVMHQSPDETFRAFAARVRGKAETCEYVISNTCTCGEIKDVNYTNESIRDVLLAGIADLEIRREAFGEKLLTVNDVIGFVESREVARNAIPTSSNAAMSAFRRTANYRQDCHVATKSVRHTATTPIAPPTAPLPTLADRAKQAPCPDCGKHFSLFSESVRGWNRKAHERCRDCYLVLRRQRNSSRNNVVQPKQTFVHAIEILETPFLQLRHRVGRHHTTAKTQVVSLQHHIFTKNEWRRAKFATHPTVKISVRIDGNTKSRQSPVVVDINAVTDSGAQSDVWSLDHFLAAGFSRADLHPVSLNLEAANKSKIKIDGAFFGVIEGCSPRGEKISCRTMIYVSSDIQNFFLSYESLVNLCILPLDFPTIGSAVKNHRVDAENRSILTTSKVMNAAVNENGVDSCGCPKRQAPPDRPSKLPFLCVAENNSKMRDWLLEKFSASTFNTCPHQPLPMMDGPPIDIHLDDSAMPRTCYTAAPIPVHWQEKVHADLLRDEALGVIERVPYGEPSTWCHRMVVTRKQDGTPRRTVDLSPLNRYCKREPFAADSPFHLARRIPGNTWKTVTDAWNGYHSTPLRESDRHLTTFITPFGRWRYCRAPQGFLSSGDGYNRRFDAILTDFERKERCVDDTVHYDEDLEAHWWRTIDFLIIVGNAGVVLNPTKFQFAKREVEFAGFCITDSTIEPLHKYFDAIMDFPTPVSITDVRSWFGLVNQVSNYAQLRDLMAPFRPFLSPKCKFVWSKELDDAFKASKVAIVKAIHKGVRIFDA